MREGRRRTQSAALALCDAAMALLAMQAAWWLRFDFNNWLDATRHWHPFGDPGWTPGQPYALAIFVALPLFGLILREMNLYDEPESGESEFFRLASAAFMASALLAAIGFYYKTNFAQQQFQFSRGYSLLFLFSSFGCLWLGRKIYRACLRFLAQRGIWQNRILFVGDGPLAEELAETLAARGTNIVVGALLAPETDGEHRHNSAPLRFPILGTTQDLVSVAQIQACDEVIVALPNAPQALLKQLVEDCYRAHMRFRIAPNAHEMLLDHMELALVADIPLLGMRGSRIEGVNYLIKRLFDIVVSFMLLLALIPTVFLIAAIGIKLTSSGPIFYFQERLGYQRNKFRFWKFRSMKTNADVGADAATHQDYLKKYIAGQAGSAKDAKGRAIYKITDDPRVTPFGRILRQYSLDELPQLWNVLKGDMSLIGPRPPIAYEVENYQPIHLRRFETLPGISGLWQISGRNQLTFEEMVKLDIYYLENWSLELDMRILFKTISVVLFQRAY